MLNFIKRLAGRPIANRARRLAAEFLDQTNRAGEVQRDLLLARIARNADSQFGRDHHFHEIRTPADFRKRVPIGDYNRHEPYIDRVRKGDVSALFGAGTDVLMFAMTSGTTNRPKTIPVTREALKDYREGWTIWGILAFDGHPNMIDHGLRPILQIASDWRESHTAAGIPCGAITGLTASMQNPLVRTTYCMPACASRIKDVESKYYVALRFSIARDLGTVIAANPSTILGMFRLGDRERETLIRDLHDGTIDAKWSIPDDIRKQLRFRTRIRRKATAKRLEAIVEETGRLLPRDYWPNLEFLSNWMGGTMRAYLRGYPEFFGDKPVRDVGLIASEGRMTIPIEDGTAAGVLDIRHHYFEFIPEEQGDLAEPDTVEAVDLIEGRNYFIILTTAGGLYRYNIFDLVRCVGFHGKAPVVEFLNKGAHFSSLTGEKLSEHQVVAAVEAAQRAVGIRLRSYLLLPIWGEPPSYGLLVETSDLPETEAADRFTAAVEEQLRALNVEYACKRDTLRLGPVRTIRLPNGAWGEFQKRRLARSGGTVEQYKQPHLIPDTNEINSFSVLDSVAP
ncbi:MAG: GH3 auxin-responsive promoter family protein [Paludisphaera borealis]|uniref:GH3 auxin-responsive promoter family protein n=1 Tax=Paludisphaera borealis TaxID=1387353 RepID=UPI0028521AE0|nr:GH3 auxin-responsive promoter family protein [Paludisphaera borealis]MDR3618148.1 GH3 auxin-responsive promoter family protein [Paludisphaera borealis]